ncbi:MarR family transcriptional regulator [Streptomyces sp. NPDC059928]|uniref:MarR family transcriptional regulator n=1 Tax=unclassified Streptomyces TaxID=2593676 RepID=UPI00366A1ADB
MGDVREAGLVVVDAPARWGFLSSHARVLLAIASDPDVRLRDIAASCGVTERTALSVIADLERAGYLRRERRGRRNRYTLEDSGRLLRHPDDRYPASAVLALFSGRRRRLVNALDAPGAV